MNLENYYWFFQNVVPARICDEIIKYGLQLKERMALTGGYTANTMSTKAIKDLKTKRDSNIVWLAENWIYKEIHPYLNLANKNAGWNFQWDWSESCQFTKYTKGQYYDWHCDSWETPYNHPNSPSHGKIRKLSITLCLSGAEDFKGGDLEFDFRRNDPDKKRAPRICKEVRSKGSLVIFPSFVWHRVKPVTKGSRYSLVIWNLGWPFK